jgi:glyoxylase I family protein
MAIKLNAVHHIAIICTNYEVSKRFYIDVLGLTVVKEIYRAERDSYKLDLALNGQYSVELFSFPDPAKRPSRPEAAGLRHLAFEVNDLNEVVTELQEKGVSIEPIRVDEFTSKRFTFIADPDGLPLEFYEK